MTFIQRNDVIQQVSSAAFDPALRHTILPRTPQRSADTFDFHRSNRGGDLRSILGITIEDDEPRGRPRWKRFSQLLNDPQAGRVPGDVDVQDPSTGVVDDEEAVEHMEGDRWNREEVHRGDGFPMISKKGEPTFGRLRISRSPFHPTRDRSLGEIKAEHEEFPMYPRCSPGRVLGDYLEDQLPNFFRGPSPPDWRPDSGNQPPIQTESRSVPTDYGFGRDDDEGLLPTGPGLPSNYPEELIEEAEDRPWTAPLQHSELLPEREILEDEMPTATKRASKRSEPEKKQIEHGPELYQIKVGNIVVSY
jgi:hypothetical protein